MSKRILRGDIKTQPSSPTSLFATVSEDKLPERHRARGKSPRDLVLQQAEEIREAARQEGFAEGKRQGYEEGHQEGLEVGRNEATEQIRLEHAFTLQQELQVFVQDLDALAVNIQRASEEWFAAAELRLASIASEVVSRLLSTELRTSPDSVLELVRACLKEAGEHSRIKIVLNALDHSVLSNLLPQLQQEIGQNSHIELVSNPFLAGGCMIEAGATRIDASLDTMTKLIQEEAA